VRPALAVLVLLLNVIALVSIMGGRAAPGRKLAWMAAVVLLPVVGSAGWLATRRGTTSERQR
jgi:hypothetical protein